MENGKRCQTGDNRSGDRGPQPQSRSPLSCAAANGAEEIELFVMGRLANPEIREHLSTCKRCEPLVAEYRNFIKNLKICLRDISERESSSRMLQPDHKAECQESL